MESPAPGRNLLTWSGKAIQNSNGKGQMENHLKFAICHLPFDLLVCL
jgi:hypothetical protein